MPTQTEDNVYERGDLIRITGTWTTLAGVATDPTTIKLSVKDPSGNVLTSTYGSGTGSAGYFIEKTSTGIYYANIDADEAGLWTYRWWSTGSGQAAKEQTFRVEEAQAI